MQRGIYDYPMRLNAPVDSQDRFAYGWRYVNEARSAGSEQLVKIPLTLEDILHPQEEDFRVHNDPHITDVLYLREVFYPAVSCVPGAVVLSDCRVAWDEAGAYGHGPDCAVIFNVRERKFWGTFNVVREGTRPALIIEVTSPTTRSTDLYNKVWEYAEQKVPRYVIADAREKDGVRTIRFIDYRLDDEGEYVSQPLGPNGRVWLDEVKLWLGSENGLLACYDADGKRLGTYVELDQARRDAENATVQERQAREALEKRVRDLEARLHGSANGKQN